MCVLRECTGKNSAESADAGADSVANTAVADSVVPADTVSAADTVAKADSVATPEATFDVEGIARKIYTKAVLADNPDYSVLRKNCSKQFLDKLAKAYRNEYDGKGYAVWYLRSGEMDGDGKSRVVDVTVLDKSEVTAGDAAVRVKYLDMGTPGTITLCFENGKMIDALKNGKSIFR